MTLPGVGPAGAQALYAALGDWRRFKDGAHAASYLGLTPSTRQSADHCYHGSITKAGNSLARWLLTQAARQVAEHPGPLGVFFRRIEKRKNYNVAVVATARKLVTIAFLMLKKRECSNGWESLIFHKGSKLSRHAPINPVKQQPRTKQSNYNSESLRLCQRWNKGLIAGPCISWLGGNS